MFDKILNWRLLSGSHKFPGPDGGTCINEAAIVAAGFKYRKVDSANDCPPCFSRVIAGYAIRLNDAMPDDLRQELLMPFVVMLAGTADTDAKEIERAQYIALHTIKRILPISLRIAGLEDRARRCEQAPDLADAAASAADAACAAAHAAAAAAADADADAACAAAHAAAAARAAHAHAAADAAARAAYAAARAAAAADADAAAAARAVYAAAHAAAAAADRAAYAAYARKEIFTAAVAILDEAIRLGKQSEPIETALVVSRMEAIKRRALETA